ncbi:hypothetical protein V8C35DRAFT_283053 [Trichoderma chlorosporum]
MDDAQQGHMVDASLAFLQKLEDEMRLLSGSQLGSSDSSSSSNSSATLDSLSVTRKRKRSESPGKDEASKKIRTVSAGQDNVVFGPAEPPRRERSRQLPAELWHHIFSFLPPDTLGRLLRVSRLFHKYLDPVSPFVISTPVIHVPTPRTLPALSPDAIWRASRCLHWPTMPAPLKGRFELDMWRFACARSCQFCGQLDNAYSTEDSSRRSGPGNNTVSPIFQFFINACGNCLTEKSVTEVELHISHASFISPGLPMVFLTPDKNVISPHALRNCASITVRLTKIYWPAQVEGLKAELEEVKRFGAAAVEEWVKGLDTRGIEATNDASRWDKWFLSGGIRQMRMCSSSATANKVFNSEIQSQIRAGTSQLGRTPIQRAQDRIEELNAQLRADIEAEAQQKQQNKSTKGSQRQVQQDIDTAVRAYISDLADQAIEDLEVHWRRLTKKECAGFVTEALAYIRKQFYIDGAQAVARRLILDDMRWVFDHKIAPNLHHKEFFLCKECPKSKYYGFQAVIQHHASKHCSKKKKTSILHWRAEWPEELPFSAPMEQKVSAKYESPDKMSGALEPRRHLETYYLHREHVPYVEVETRHTSHQSYDYRQPIFPTSLYQSYDIGIRGLPNVDHIGHDYNIPSNMSYANYSNREAHNNTSSASRVYNAYDSRDLLTNRGNDSVPTIAFTNVDDLLSAIAAAPGDALTVTNVYPMDYEMLCDKGESMPIKFRLSLYTASARCLWITIPTGAHENLHTGIYSKVSRKIDAMGLEESWLEKGSTTFKSTRPYFGGGGGDGGGEGDSSGGPHPERRSDKAYPTLVVEAGVSHTLEELRVKARAWFSRSRHDVKIVILAKLEEAEHRITLERWEERPRGLPREGATTRWAAELIPGCQQIITITVDNPALPVYEITCTSGDLALDFRLLFLRDPRSGEGDVVITVADLQRYALRIWRGLEYL